MGLSKEWRFTRGVWLVAAVLVSVGAFLYMVPTELDVSIALTQTDSLPLDQGADGRYFAVPQQEAEETDKNPLNADLLRMLLLAVSYFFGLSVGWLLTNSQRQGHCGPWAPLVRRWAGHVRTHPS